jgi:hypothetical protein
MSYMEFLLDDSNQEINRLNSEKLNRKYQKKKQWDFIFLFTNCTSLVYIHIVLSLWKIYYQLYRSFYILFPLLLWLLFGLKFWLWLWLSFGLQLSMLNPKILESYNYEVFMFSIWNCKHEISSSRRATLD